MKPKRDFSFNRTFNLFIILGIFLALCSYAMFTENDIGMGIGLSVLSLLFIGVPCVLEPCFYTFDSEGVSIYRVFFPVERYLWKNIHEIYATEERTTKKSLFFSWIFEINGIPEGESRFYMKGEIRRTARTKRYIKKYWDGEISGYLVDDIKSWWNKRESKKNKIIKQHLTDEIVPIEREIRAKVRGMLSPLSERAKENGYELRTEYLYVTKDLKEFKSRPNEGYTYTLVIEISKPNEKDEDLIACIDVELIFVRLGKKAYKGIINDKALSQLELSTSEALDEIVKVGIKEYCK